MQVIQDALHTPDLPFGAVATVGNYDGIHRGQRAVIDRVGARAEELGAPAVVVTFEPHPVSVLRPDEAPAILTPGVQRHRLLEEAGVDALVIIHFTPDFAKTEAEDFARDFLHRQLGVEELYVGSSFVFGRGRKGGVELLRKLGSELGFEVHGVDEVIHRGEVVSSTRIRRAIREGKVELAMELLGRPYGLHGSVARGDRMGARLGWPTINLIPENELLPCDGVYGGQVQLPSFPGLFDCVTNVGTRPTVYENYQRVVESHILGFSADVYGEEVEIRFFKRLREEKIFPTVMELSAQIGRDVEATREYFAARRRLEELGEG